MKNKPNFFLITGVSQTGGEGGGPPLGNFSHIIPFFSEIKTFATGEAVDAGRPPPGGRQQRLHLDGISELSHRTKSQEIEDLSMNP